MSLRVGFEASKSTFPTQNLILILPVDLNPDVELSIASPAPYLPACHHAPYNNDSELKL